MRDSIRSIIGDKVSQDTYIVSKLNTSIENYLICLTVIITGCLIFSTKTPNYLQILICLILFGGIYIFSSFRSKNIYFF